MELLEVEREQTLTREDAAGWLEDLARQLARNNQLQFRRDGMKYTLRVPDQVTMEVEIEVADDGANIELEIRW
ncbi:MAG: amphi-Trp domain-containing protein [Actinomycetota bacterium]